MVFSEAAPASFIDRPESSMVCSPAVSLRARLCPWRHEGAAPILWLLVPYPAAAIEAYQVVRAVNNPANEGVALLAPVVV